MSRTVEDAIASILYLREQTAKVLTYAINNGFPHKHTQDAVDEYDIALAALREKAERENPQHEKDPCQGCGYKAYYEQVASQNDCNTCGALRTCQYVPRIGSICRINCPLWKPKV